MRLPFDGSFPITQVFGVNPQDYAQFGMRGHNGIDYGLPTGTPVLAAVSGKIYRGWDEGGYGNFVFVTGEGYETVVAHLGGIAVAQGANVQAGELVGWSDNTGNSSGPHLHFGARPIGYDRNNGFLGYTDPAPLIGVTPTNDLATITAIAEDRLKAIRILQAEKDAVVKLAEERLAGLYAAWRERDEALAEVKRLKALTQTLTQTDVDTLSTILKKVALS